MDTFTVTFQDAHGSPQVTSVEVTEGNASLPLVVLLHGTSGTAADMTDPAVHPGFNYDCHAIIPAERDRGWHDLPGIGIWSVEVDQLKAVTGWRPALQAAGFPTLSYGQVEPRGPLASALQQLTAVADQVIQPRFPDRGLAFIGHSRGGILLRKFLVDQASNADLIGRVVAAITLHSPNQGSQLANVTAEVSARINLVRQALLSAPSTSTMPAELVLRWLDDQVHAPAYREFELASRFLAELVAQEPVPGIRYHTFGGNSTRYLRVRSNEFTPLSQVPQLHQPAFHWTTRSVELLTLFEGVANLSDLGRELRPGEGDGLVADLRAHLPFAQSRHTNPLNHAEALWDPNLQRQVINILRPHYQPATFTTVNAAGWTIDMVLVTFKDTSYIYLTPDGRYPAGGGGSTEVVYDGSQTALAIASFRGSVFTAFNGGWIYRSPDGRHLGGGAATRAVYEGDQQVVAMTGFRGGVLTAFDGGGVYLSSDGNNLGGGGATELVYDAGEQVIAMIPFQNGVITAFSGNWIYRSPDGRHPGGGGDTRAVYEGDQRVVAITAFHGGILTAFDGGGIYLSPDGNNLGGGGATELVYDAGQKVVTIIPFHDGVITAFDGGWIYRSPDGRHPGGGGDTPAVYEGDQRVVAMTGFHGGVLTAFDGGGIYISPDGNNLGGGGATELVYPLA